ncbi:MAG: hypothetical protein ACFN27_04040, partial [Prevotella sp.]
MAKHIFIFFASPGVYLSALSARFSAARDEGRQKQPSGGEKPQFFDGISRRERKNRDFLSEIGKNRASNPLENQNHPIFCVSNPLENQNRSISEFPT